MKVSELPEWFTRNVQEGAVRMRVRRCERKGRPGGMLDAFDLDDTFDPKKVLEACDDDRKDRRLQSAYFYFEGVNAEGEPVLTGRAQFGVETLDDESEDPITGNVTDLAGVVRAMVGVTNMVAALARDMKEFTTTNMQHSQDAILKLADKLAERVVVQDGHMTKVVEQTLELSTMQREREQDMANEETKRRFQEAAIERLAPVIGSIAGHVMGANGDKRLAAFFATLNEEQRAVMWQSLSPEQQAMLGEIFQAWGAKNQQAQTNGVAS